ncbi:MAG TPA: hypothetical protein VGN83_20935 [Falsiroseomonas sp.]|jgi:hypothetical protein|nr:hypothetical protein [Falsiroseomonas sp.]
MTEAERGELDGLRAAVTRLQAEGEAMRAKLAEREQAIDGLLLALRAAARRALCVSAQADAIPSGPGEDEDQPRTTRR